MTYYPFIDSEDNVYGSFETLYIDEHDHVWDDIYTYWNEFLCEHIDKTPIEIEKINGKVADAQHDGFEETFYLFEDEKEAYKEMKQAYKSLSGWYWWPCFPGCLPDGDPIGPFDYEQEAIDNAREV